MTSREFRQRLSRRAKRVGLALNPLVVDRLEAYLRVLARWNRKINLTALSVDEPDDETLDRLLLEPAAAARFVPDQMISWMDVGSGGGSPAIPLKLSRPAATLTMVESKARKVAFLREVIRALQLTGADVVHARFEQVVKDFSEGHQARLVTVRAVRPDRHLIAGAATVLSQGGQLLLFGSEAGNLPPDSRFSFTQASFAGWPSSRLVIARRS